jgi:hypothetical protein
MSRGSVLGSSVRFVMLLSLPLAALSASACKSGGDTDGGAGENNGSDEFVLDPTEEHFGRSNAEWAARWWQWLYELPQESGDDCTLPVTDPTGASCTYGQTEDVFFLAGNFAGESVVRDECVIPEGKAIFFPIVSLSNDNGGVPEDLQSSPEELEELAQNWVDDLPVDEIEVELDGTLVEDMERFKTDPVAYSYELPPEPNTYSCLGATGVEGTVDPSFVTGYSIMLAPPEPGDHVLHFTAPAITGISGPVDVTYEFRVE